MKNWKRKTMCLGLVAALILTGCQAKNVPSSEETTLQDTKAAATEPEKATEEEKKEPVELSLWYTANESDPNDRDHSWLSETVELFQKENPHITVKTTIIGGAGGNDYRTKLSAEIASNNAPDVFMTWGWDRLVPFAEAGKLYDLTDIIKQDEALSEVIVPENLAGVTYKEKVYALPDAIDLQGLFYNKQIFEENGLELPKTTDELIAVSKTLRERGITPVALGNSVTWPTLIPYSTLLADIGGDAFYKELEKNGPQDFSSEEYIRTMGELNRLVDAGVFTDNFNGIQPPESAAAFKQGQAAMFLQGTWQISGLVAEMGDNVGYISFPTTDAGKTLIQKVIPKAYAVSADTKYPEETLAFLKFMYSPDRQKAFNEKGAIVTTRNVGIDVETMPSLKQDVMKLLESDAESIYMIDVFCSTNVATELKKVVQGCTAGSDINDSFVKLQTFKEQN